MSKDKLIRKFNRQVKMHENNQNNPNSMAWRRKLIKDAYGKVLEVGVGVGSNFPYYNKGVQLTGVDFSPDMLKSAKNAASSYQIQSEFLQADIDELSMESNTFDTIVSTLTLCCYPNPISTLNNFNDWCKKEGRVLLMEHGLSSKAFFSIIQNIADPIHTKITGCHCNRNIQQLIEKSKLQLEHIESFWSGTVHLIWAKPTK